MQRRWIFSSDADPVVFQAVQRELSIPAFLARILVNRGFSEPVDADTEPPEAEGEPEPAGAGVEPEGAEAEAAREPESHAAP